MHDDWDEEPQDDYIEEEDAAASRIHQDWVTARADKRLTKALRQKLDDELSLLSGPIRLHETGRLLYFDTNLDEMTIAYLVRVPPFDIHRFFHPWIATATMCRHGVEVATRWHAHRPPTHCDACAYRGRQQPLFELPLPQHEVSWIEYHRHMNSAKWHRTRRAKLAQQSCCEVCDSKEQLDVHHKTYKRFGNERLEDLVVLCRNCHDAFHRHRKAQ